MTAILDDFSPTALINAIEENHIESWSHFGRVGGNLYRDQTIVRVASAIPYIPYNGIMYSNWDDSDVDAKIEETVAYFQSRNAQMIWAINPSTQPADMADRLVAHGFTMVQELVGMAMDLDKLPTLSELPPRTEIREVTDSQSLRQYVDLIAWKWQLPPEGKDLAIEFNQQYGFGADKAGRRWLVYQDGVPVAKAFLCLAAGAAGIYGVSTIPEARRQGLGNAVTLTALLAARQFGYRIGVLHSTEIGEGIYRRLGFQEYCRILIYALT